MDALILALAIYFIIIGRWQRFEWTIVLCMFLKYALYAFMASEAYMEYIKYDSVIYAVIASLNWTLGPICHLIYASQYLKTCFLTNGILKRAI